MWSYLLRVEDGYLHAHVLDAVADIMRYSSDARDAGVLPTNVTPSAVANHIATPVNVNQYVILPALYGVCLDRSLIKAVTWRTKRCHNLRGFHARVALESFCRQKLPSAQSGPSCHCAKANHGIEHFKLPVLPRDPGIT